MRSKASFKSHPLHPMLIAFPVAFLSGAFLFDVGSEVFNKPQWWNVGSTLALVGVITGLIAAIPGIIDYIATVPPKSSAKKRAATHGLLNTTHILVFTAAWWLKPDGNGISHLTIILMEAAGVAILGVAGWLGGTLVYRNQIGVDPRYANAGKWKEAYLREEHLVEVASITELLPNQMKLLHVGSRRIVLGRTEKGYVAFDDRCTHRGGSLAGGTMICGMVQCPWHGSQFDVTTGGVAAGPAAQRINTYQLLEKDGKVYLQL